MSYRLIYNWVENDPCLHTAIDDLESFPWVVFWAALHSHDSTSKMMEWAGELSQDSPAALKKAKISIRTEIIGEYQALNLTKYSPFFGSIYSLLQNWFILAAEAQKAVNSLAHPSRLNDPLFDHTKFVAELRDLCLDYYVKYLEAGVEFLRKNGVYGDTA